MSGVLTRVSVVMVDVTPVGAPARHLLLEQLGALALDSDPLVKLGHFSLPVLLQHAWMRGHLSCPTTHQSNC